MSIALSEDLSTRVDELGWSSVDVDDVDDIEAWLDDLQRVDPASYARFVKELDVFMTMKKPGSDRRLKHDIRHL